MSHGSHSERFEEVNVVAVSLWRNHGALHESEVLVVAAHCARTKDAGKDENVVSMDCSTPFIDCL